MLIFKTHTFKQNEHYLFSDEKLKFVHILESFNYQKVAGNNGITIPKTYYEFGCHSGRTFCSAINAAEFLNQKDFEFFALVLEFLIINS